MLAALNIAAVGLGMGAGGLSATVLALVLGGLLTVMGVDNGSDIGLVAGVIAGLAIAGWVSGHMARHSERFHGAVTGVLLAGVVILVARMGGSPASTPTVVWLAVVAAFVAGLTGWLAGRRKRSGT
jgi:putative membrane protein (TIGR04086 family)